MKTGYTLGLFHRTLCGFCLLMALAAQAGWEGYPPLQNRYKEHEFLAACREGNCPAVNFYLEIDGFNCNEEHNSGLVHEAVTGLYIASQEGHTEAVSTLIAAGADIDRCCREGETPLYVASQNGHTKIVKNLIAAGADLDRSWREGVTPLSIASQNGQTEVVRALVAAGADLDRSCPEGTTSLFMASQNGHAEIVRMLVEAGANPSIAWCFSGPRCLGVSRRTPLTQAKNMKLFTLPRSAKRRTYSSIISMLSQAYSHSRPPEKNDTDHQTDAPHLLSAMSRLSLSGKPPTEELSIFE